MKKKPNNQRNENTLNSEKKVSRIVLFYLGLLPDNKDRYIEDIWEYSNIKLEIKHDYIQWLFPTKERSQHNPSAPVLREADIKIIRSNKQIKKNMIISFETMLRFYGLKLVKSENGITVQIGENFTKRSVYWLTKRNHNYLRITRMLKSLNLFGLYEYSREFYRALITLYKETGIIPKETMKYWQKAYYSNLN